MEFTEEKLKAIRDRAKAEPEYAKQVGEKLQQNKDFANAMRAYQDGLGAKPAPAAQEPVTQTVTPEPEKSQALSAFDKFRKVVPGMQALNAGIDAVKDLSSDDSKIKSGVNFAKNQLTAELGEKDETKSNIGKEIFKSTLGEDGLAGYTRSVLSPATVGIETKSLTESIKSNVDQQVKLIQRIKDSKDPQSISKLGNLVKSLRDEEEQMSSQIDGVQEKIPTNREGVGQAVNTVTSFAAPGSLKSASTAATTAPGFLKGMLGVAKNVAPISALAAGGDSLSKNQSYKTAGINAAIGGATAIPLGVLGRTVGRYFTSKGQSVAREIATDKNVRKATATKVGSGARDAANRAKIETVGGNGLFTSKDVLATDEGRERAIKLIKDEINSNQQRLGKIQSNPDIAKATQGKITELETELSDTLTQVELPDFQKTRMLTRFKETLKTVESSFAGNGKKDTQVRVIISNYMDAVKKSTNVNDMLSARKAFDAELENRIAGYAKVGDNAPKLIEDLRKLRGEAADAIIDSLPSGEKQFVIDSLNNQHVLINAINDITDNTKIGSKLQKFLQSPTGQQARSVGGAFLGLGVGALGTAAGLGGFRSN